MFNRKEKQMTNEECKKLTELSTELTKAVDEKISI